MDQKDQAELYFHLEENELVPLLQEWILTIDGKEIGGIIEPDGTFRALWY